MLETCSRMAAPIDSGPVGPGTVLASIDMDTWWMVKSMFISLSFSELKALSFP